MTTLPTTLHWPKLLHFDKIYALLALPVTDAITRMCLYAEVQRRQALTACALERYFLDHQFYPKTLSELMPAPPLDPLSGGPFSFSLTASGRYRLWAHGFDGKDDSGHVSLSAKSQYSNLSKANYLGDWTWCYEPVIPMAAPAE